VPLIYKGYLIALRPSWESWANDTGGDLDGSFVGHADQIAPPDYYCLDLSLRSSVLSDVGAAPYAGFGGGRG
jgi:hypothetical protein